MSEPKPLASLSAGLLARKGAARPAMRPQLVPHQQGLASDLPPPAPADAAWNDLGWNDMGAAEPAPVPAPAVVPLHPETPVAAPAAEPAVRRQQAEVARKVAAPRRRSALADGRKAAFTLRLDAERHLKLRLACTLGNQSAQAVVTEALDRLLGELPDLDHLASQLAERRRP